MFGMSIWEIAVVMAVALIFIGPKKLPDLAKSLGRALGEFKRATSDFKDAIHIDAEVDDVRESLNDIRQETKNIIDINPEKPDHSPDQSSDAPDAATALEQFETLSIDNHKTNTKKKQPEKVIDEADMQTQTVETENEPSPVQTPTSFEAEVKTANGPSETTEPK